MTEFVFWVFAIIAIGAALVCVTRRSPVASALWLVLSMFSLAGVYVLLDAQFIAAVQVNHSGEFDGLQAWDPVENPDYTLVDAQVGVAGENWEFTINAENLFDEDHYVDLQRFPNLYTLDGGENILIGTLGQPRLITGNLTVHF